MLCEAGSCGTRLPDTVDVRGDINLHRDFASEVASFVHVLVGENTATGSFSCEAALDGDDWAPGLSTLAAGYKAVSGGSFHPEVNLGRGPERPIGVLVRATDGPAGTGNVLGFGCVAPTAPSDGMLNVGLIQVNPLPR